LKLEVDWNEWVVSEELGKGINENIKSSVHQAKPLFLQTVIKGKERNDW
jgi:hypothetical protein